MNRLKLTGSAIALTLLGLTNASGARAEAASGDIKTALQECAASVNTDDNGRPDRSAMDECMTAKGFTKPLGKRAGGRPGSEGGESQASGQYVDKAALEAALTECRSMVATDDTGQPNRTEVDTCMEVKGFKKPEREKRGPGRGRANSASGSSRGGVKSAR